MAERQKYNPITGEFNLVTIPNAGSGSNLITNSQTATTTNATPTLVAGGQTITTTTTTFFKSLIIGRRTNAPIGNVYVYEIEGVVNNIAGTLTLGNITGILHQEDDVLGVSALTGHAIDVTVNGTTLDFEITGALATNITWKLETTFTEV